jgi:hypothetical protein
VGGISELVGSFQSRNNKVRNNHQQKSYSFKDTRLFTTSNRRRRKRSTSIIGTRFVVVQKRAPAIVLLDLHQLQSSYQQTLQTIHGLLAPLACYVHAYHPDGSNSNASSSSSLVVIISSISCTASHNNSNNKHTKGAATTTPTPAAAAAVNRMYLQRLEW